MVVKNRCPEILITRIPLTQECIRGCGHNMSTENLVCKRFHSQLRGLNLGSRTIALNGLNAFSGCPCHVIFVAVSHDIALIKINTKQDEVLTLSSC